MRVLAVALVALLLAGCASPPETPADTNQTQASVPTVEAPNDDGTKPMTAVDTGAMPHLHDYWKGRERVTLFDGDLEPDAMNLTFATIFQVFFEKTPVVGGMLWNLPEGQTIFEGTGIVELTARWDDPRVTGIGFIYRSAESPDYKSGGALEANKAFQLKITPQQTDMPHSKTSRWQFGFGPDKGPGALAGKFHLKLDIVKVNDIELFPAHPDFWKGGHAVTLIDADHRGQVDSYAKRAIQPATQGNFTEDMIKFPRTVPMETVAVRFNVTVKSASSTPGEVTSFGLFYHGAETQQPFRCPVKPFKTLPATLEWVVPSTMEMSDSPYGNESQWQFLVEPHVVLADGTPQMGGMTDVQYEFHVVATALDEKQEKLDACRVDNG